MKPLTLLGYWSYSVVCEVCGWGRTDRCGAVRVQAAELFEQEIKPSEVAQRLRVSRKSAYQWHQLWRDGGPGALASRGPGGSRCRLSPRCLEKPPPASNRVRPRTAGWR
nr:helix-turn-helix domain-containing protein [Streptomyces sp. WZ-12]